MGSLLKLPRLRIGGHVQEKEFGGQGPECLGLGVDRPEFSG